MLLRSVRLLKVTEDWEQVLCKSCKGEGWLLKPPDYDDGPRCHWCGGYGKLTYAKGDKMDALTVVKQFAAFLLLYWPQTAVLVSGALTSIVAGNSSALIGSVVGVLGGVVGAKPAAVFHARLAKKAS